MGTALTEYSGKDMPYSLSMGKACREALSLGVYRDGAKLAAV